MVRKIAAFVMLAILAGTIAFLYYYTKNPIEGADDPTRGIFGLASYTVDKEGEADITGIKEISASAVSADVIVRFEDRTNIKAHFYGEVKMFKGSDEPNLTITNEEGVLRIDVEPRAISQYRIAQSNLKLEILMPLGYSGKMALKSVSGDVSVQGEASASDLIMDTVSGSIFSGDANLTGSFKANSVSGRIATAHISAQDFYAKTVSGRIEAAAVSGARSITLGSVSGSLNVGLPKETGFKIVATTVSGKISCDFPLQVETGTSKKLAGSTGDGSADLQLSTISGSINVGAL